MANFSCNIAKGRAIELYQRVDTNDPANSALIVVLLATAGLEADDVLTDAATLAAMVSGTTNEATNTGYSRKVLTDADIAALPAPDNALNQRTMAIPNQTWINVLGDGTGAIAKLVVCYDPDTTAGTDADIIPLSHHDFAVNPIGNNVQTNFDVLGFYRAAQTCP